MNEIAAFDFSVDVLSALLWEYNQATTLTSILEQKQTWYTLNQTTFWNNWFNDVFNLKTANEFGCDVWAIILGVPLQSISPEDFKINWGFGNVHKNFNNGNFTHGGSNVNLSLAQRRLLLQLMYYKTFTRCAIPEINAMLKDVLGSFGTSYVLAGTGMSPITYMIHSEVDTELTYVLQNYDVLPRPAGIDIQIIVM